jgi:hypothetical protein
MLKVIGITSCLFIGIITLVFLNYCIIEPILIPDSCAYHAEDTSNLFNLLYKMDSIDGYHPFPTLFNFLLTMTLGVISGLAVYRYGKSVLTK